MFCSFRGIISHVVPATSQILVALWYNKCMHRTCVYLSKGGEVKDKLYSSCIHACVFMYFGLYLRVCRFTCMHMWFLVYQCMHACVCVCVFILHCSPHSARHSMYSSALLIAGCWSKIIVIFQPVGLKSYNIMKCIKKRGKWQTGGMLNQM